MNREEIIEQMVRDYYPNETASSESIKDSISKGGYVNLVALYDKGYRKEQDTLKEFVEYLKSTKKYQAWDEDTDTMGVSWGKRYTSPNHQLDKDLEDFIKERDESAE